MATREMAQLAVVGTVTPLVGGIPDDRVREGAWAARCAGRGHAFLLSDSELSLLAPFLHRRQIPWGTTLASRGMHAEGMWIIKEGRVHLFVGAGRQHQIVQVIERDDVLGDLELALGAKFAYSARAATDTVALYLDRPSFDRLMVDRPELARRWLTNIARRASNGQHRIVGLLGKTLPVQVARLLREEAVHHAVNLPQRTLAAMLGVQRPSLNKVLKDLEKRGLIEVGYGRVTIRDPAGLAHLAG